MVHNDGLLSAQGLAGSAWPSSQNRLDGPSQHGACTRWSPRLDHPWWRGRQDLGGGSRAERLAAQARVRQGEGAGQGCAGGSSQVVGRRREGGGGGVRRRRPVVGEVR
jgi:hypothetical protein